jgi:Leucine-rich repeat (LRR) protein
LPLIVPKQGVTVVTTRTQIFGLLTAITFGITGCLVVDPAVWMHDVNDREIEQLKPYLTPDQYLLKRVSTWGGTLQRACEEPPTPFNALDLHETRITDADLAILDELPGLQVLNLHSTHITDAGLVHLESLEWVHTLYLNDTEVSDAGLEHLHKLPRLRMLGLCHTHVTDQGLAVLSRMPTLQNLSVTGKGITDASVATLLKMHDLHQLNLCETAISDAGFAELKKKMRNTTVIR